MLAKVRKTIDKHRMIAPGDRVLVGLSGGADSVALLSVLDRLRPALGHTLAAAHFNHRTRGAESDRDEAHARRLCETLRIDLVTGALATRRPTGVSLEDFLRRERYGFLQGTAEAAGANRIALGHHRADQAETVLMNLIRGSGTAGLAGIPAVRNGGLIIRPLIDCSRRDITGYLGRKGLPCVEDRSNLDERFLRNRIRSRLMPELERHFNPSIGDTLCRLADVLREENGYMTGQAQAHLSGWTHAQPPGREGRLAVPVGELRQMHTALRRRVILEIARDLAGVGSAIGFEHVQAVLDLAGGRNPGGTLDLPGGLSVRRTYGLLEFCRAPGKSRAARSKEIRPVHIPRQEVPATGTVRLEGVGLTLRFREMRRAPSVSTAGRKTYLDLDRVSGPLVLRGIEPGDRIQPLGMKGTRKLKSLLIDEKIPRDLRGRMAVLADDLSVLWVPGLRLSERVRVGEGTRRVLSAEII